MHRFLCERSSAACAMLCLLSACAMLALISAVPLCAATPVTIKIKTQPPTTINAGFSGFNVPQPRNGVEYYDPKFLTAATPLNPGWLRFPGGTDSLDFEWTTGQTNIAWMDSLIDGNPPEVSGQSANILSTSQILTFAKGGVLFSDFATFAQALGAWAVVCYNSYTDSPSDAAQMVQAAQTYGLKVEDWELGNEAYQYPVIYPTPASYAAASHNFFGKIRSADNDARISLFPAGWYPGVAGCTLPQPCMPTWDSNLYEYSPLYWNAASVHIYPMVGEQSGQDNMFALNGILAYGSSDYMNNYIVPLVGTGTPIFITEFNCCSGYNNPFLPDLYNGIFLAEYIARVSTVPTVKGVGVDALYSESTDNHGVIQAVNSSTIVNDVLIPLAQSGEYTDTATNPETQYQFYTSAPGLALQVANQAINSGTIMWPTTVDGGPTVQITGFDGQPIPAIYAQMYLGSNGSHYLLITNKSSQAQKVTIEIDGSVVQATFNVTYVSNSDPLASNTAAAPTNVQIQTNTTSHNPIELAQYSVTTVVW